jgi:hypothetical protein
MSPTVGRFAGVALLLSNSVGQQPYTHHSLIFGVVYGWIRALNVPWLVVIMDQEKVPAGDACIAPSDGRTSRY